MKWQASSRVDTYGEQFHPKVGTGIASEASESQKLQKVQRQKSSRLRTTVYKSEFITSVTFHGHHSVPLLFKSRSRATDARDVTRATFKRTCTMTVTEDLQDLDTVVPRVNNNQSSFLVQLYTAWAVKFAILLTTLTILSVIMATLVKDRDPAVTPF